MENKRLLSRIFIPSIADLFFVTVLLALFFSKETFLLADGDTGYHIRAGEQILRTGSVPRFDMFSLHTPPLPWTAHEWLSEVLMAAAHQLFGLTGVVACSALLLAGTTSLLFTILKGNQSDILRPIAVTLFALVSSQIHWLARPHLFSLLLMVIFHYLIDSWHVGRANRLYLLPPLMLLWVNLHGGYLGGFILAGAYLVGNTAGLPTLPPAGRAIRLRKLGQLALATSLCLAVCLVNPYGYRILLFPLRLVLDGYMMDHVVEFLSPNFHGWLPFKYLLLLLIAALALSRKRLEPSELVLVVVFTNMALYSTRYIPLFALVTAPILNGRGDADDEAQKGGLSQFLKERSRRIAELDSRTAGHLWPAAALVAVAAAIWCGASSHDFDQKSKPIAAGEFLMRQKITGNMFNNDEFGDYLIYRCYPPYKVFIDGRLDMYGSERLKEYRRVTGFEPGWESVLEKYGVTWMLIPAGSGLSRFLLKDRHWGLIYSDPVANIFVKDIPEHRDLLARYRPAPAVTGGTP